MAARRAVRVGAFGASGSRDIAGARRAFSITSMTIAEGEYPDDSFAKGRRLQLSRDRGRYRGAKPMFGSSL